MRRFIGPGEAWSIVTALSYTTVNILLRAAAVEIDPWVGSLLRQAPVAILAWGVVMASQRPVLTPGHDRFLGWRLIGALTVAGFVSFVAGNVLFFGGLANAGLGAAAAGAQGGVVLAGALGAALLLTERPNRFGWLGIAIIVAGLGAIALAQGTPGAGWLLGLGLALGAGASYAVANLVTRIVQRRRALLFVTLAASSLGGFGALLAIQLIRSPADPLLGTDAGTVLVVLLAGGVNALALVGIVQSLRHLSVAASSSIQSATVVFSFLGAIVIFGESAAPLMVGGVVAVAVGIVAAQLRRATPVSPEPAVTPRSDPAAS
jgi:drug/metabolite transporter (DMT)-like permease